MKPFHLDEIIQFRMHHPAEYAHLRAAIIEECAKIADAEPIPGEPPPKILAQLERAGVVAVGNSAVVATKKNIAAAIRALKDK